MAGQREGYVRGAAPNGHFRQENQAAQGRYNLYPSQRCHPSPRSPPLRDLWIGFLDGQHSVHWSIRVVQCLGVFWLALYPPYHRFTLIPLCKQLMTSPFQKVPNYSLKRNPTTNQITLTSNIFNNSYTNHLNKILIHIGINLVKIYTNDNEKKNPKTLFIRE